MAIAVIGGLISSTILSLVLVPVVYELVDDFEMWVKPKLGKLVVTRKKTEADVNNAQERMNRKSKVDASPDSDAAAS
jgi:hypothetical protein